jgi:succinate dehydrogenase/fumarate reductase cytochrome b subunit
MRETKYWTWHMTAGVVILVFLGLHMLIMHVGGITHLYAPNGGAATAKPNSLSRDAMPFFTVTYIILLGAGLYHGLYGFRTILFELTLKPAAEKAVTAVLLVVGLGLFALGTWGAIAAHMNVPALINAAVGARG